MRPNDVRQYEVLARLSLLPRKIIALHVQDAPYMAELILHELCDRHCLDFDQAAYFVDNPDFDCLKGVAGFDRHDHKTNHILEPHEHFIAHMPDCRFNTLVRDLSYASYKRAQRDEQDIVRDLARDLDIKNACCIVWRLKHDNHGILLYRINHHDDDIREHIENGIHFLSFCPISH